MVTTKKGRKPWSRREMVFLCCNWYSMSPQEIASSLNRSAKSVKSKASILVPSRDASISSYTRSRIEECLSYHKKAGGNVWFFFFLLLSFLFITIRVALH